MMGLMPVATLLRLRHVVKSYTFLSLLSIFSGLKRSQTSGEHDATSE